MDRFNGGHEARSIEPGKVEHDTLDTDPRYATPPNGSIPWQNFFGKVPRPFH
jgi:hypothetical protein